MWARRRHGRVYDMADNLKFKYGTEAEILNLTPSDAVWVNRAFYYPTDKDYFYQALDGVMKKIAGGADSSVGCKINNKTIGGVKSLIETGETLEVPQYWEYTAYSLNVDGVINLDGVINII